MSEILLRIDASSVKQWVYKTLYTVPTGKTFVVSCINTTSANTVMLRINGKIIWQNRPEWHLLEFFKWLVLQSDEIVEVTHNLSGVSESILMSWSLLW